MKIVFLDSSTLGDDISLDAFDKFGEVVLFPSTTPDLTLERIGDADVIVTNKVVITDEIMQNTPNLKLICIAATGMNNVDLDAAKNRGVVVKNVAGYSTESVVQITLSQVMYLLNQHSFYDNYGKKDWQNSPIFTNVDKPFYELAGKRWGIIGLGTIGRRVAEVAKAFGCEVVYYSTSGNNNDSEYERVELDELLKTSMIVSVHAPLNEQTSNLIDKDELSKLQDKSILINVGRGGIINEEALASEIDKREIYAGVDVVTKEPIINENPLLNIKHQERITITPHIAWTSVEAREKLIDGIVNNIEEFIK